MQSLPNLPLEILNYFSDIRNDEKVSELLTFSEILKGFLLSDFLKTYFRNSESYFGNSDSGKEFLNWPSEILIQNRNSDSLSENLKAGCIEN